MATKKSRLGRGLDSLISSGVRPASPVTTPAKKVVQAAPVAKKSSAPKKTPQKNPKKKSGKKKGSSKKAAAKKTTAKKIVAKSEPKVPEGTRPFPPKKETAEVVRETANGLYEVPIHLVIANPHQPRRDFHQEALEELAASIRSEGLLQPIVVRKVEDRFELIAGERRWRACQMLKLKFIPARVMQASESSSAVLALIENLQRENLNPIEEALGFASLIRDFDLTQEKVSDRVGRSRAGVANALRLLQLDREIQGYLSKGHLSVGHCKVLLGVEASDSRLLLARQTLEKGWSVRELERQVDRHKEGSGSSRSSRSVPASELSALEDLQKRMASALNTKVQLKHAAKKGRIVIEYYGNDDLQRILEKIGIGSS